MEDLSKLSDEELAERNVRCGELRIAARSEQVRINAEMDRRAAEKRASEFLASLSPEQVEALKAKLQTVAVEPVALSSGAAG